MTKLYTLAIVAGSFSTGVRVAEKTIRTTLTVKCFYFYPFFDILIHFFHIGSQE
jgi:hypothetical protein